MIRRRYAHCLATVSAVVVLGAACTTDDPEQTLPCAFYEGQVATGAVDIDDVPDEECRERIRDQQGG